MNDFFKMYYKYGFPCYLHSYFVWQFELLETCLQLSVHVFSITIWIIFIQYSITQSFPSCYPKIVEIDIWISEFYRIRVLSVFFFKILKFYMHAVSNLVSLTLNVNFENCSFLEVCIGHLFLWCNGSREGYVLVI